MSYFAYLTSAGEIERLQLEPATHSETETDRFKIIPAVSFAGLSGHQFMEQYWWNGTAWTFRGEKPSEFSSWDSNTSNWAKNEPILIAAIKNLRNIKLSECDWVTVSDTPLSDSQVSEALTYRQTLRDLPSALDMSSIDYIQDVTWPTAPAFINH